VYWWPGVKREIEFVWAIFLFVVVVAVGGGGWWRRKGWEFRRLSVLREEKLE